LLRSVTDGSRNFYFCQEAKDERRFLFIHYSVTLARVFDADMVLSLKSRGSRLLVSWAELQQEVKE
jgi:hypothetical protein